MNIEEELKRIGSLPADRMKLVERNIELKVKLTARGEMLVAIMETQHKVFKHEGESSKCVNVTCKAINDLLRSTQP